MWVWEREDVRVLQYGMGAGVCWGGSGCRGVCRSRLGVSGAKGTGSGWSGLCGQDDEKEANAPAMGKAEGAERRPCLLRSHGLAGV